ncbi:hypothetical protein EDD16DRAFT_1708830 [Pisolithus croceorrhizus]|nr:hypothetical protein EDD16DRAFT_1708830 [Pisolithus croceorrhizus]KAI6135620.1 hypothetical protein EV401DRAFT_2062688 [Pisolithus croceorrhizus]KAI6156111.1 hypothetical protein EDD17DRAFT_1764561 [Pisolithus thermaeus]
MGSNNSRQPPPEWDAMEFAQRELREAEERQRQAEEAARRAREAAERAAREAEEQRQRGRDARLAAERAAQAAREAAERIRQQREDAERTERAKEEVERKAWEAVEREELEILLNKGIQPVVIPTLADIRLAKAKVQYNDAMFHFAIAGIASSGKSPLTNAFCGMNDNNRADATPAGANETTLEISRYVDTAHGEQFPWYDVPSSGTLMTPY